MLEKHKTQDQLRLARIFLVSSRTEGYKLRAKRGLLCKVLLAHSLTLDYLAPVAAFIQQQGRAGTVEAMCPANPKINALWPFTEKNLPASFLKGDFLSWISYF